MSPFDLPPPKKTSFLYVMMNRTTVTSSMVLRREQSLLEELVFDIGPSLSIFMSTQLKPHQEILALFPFPSPGHDQSDSVEQHCPLVCMISREMLALKSRN